MTESISIVWTRHDIEEIARDRLGKSLSPESTSVVLEYLEDNYDAVIGINWDVVETAINELRDDKSIVLNQIIHGQIANGSMENWFLTQILEGRSVKLPVSDIDETAKQLAIELKYADDLGILVSLPNTTGYTEIKLTDEPISNLVYQSSERNHRLQIKRVVNLVLTEFEDRIFPNVEQILKLLIETSEQLSDCSQAIVVL